MEDAVAFVAGFYQSIMDKAVDDIRACYWPAPETYVILEGPRLATKGYEQIAAGWGDFCDSSIVLAGIVWKEGPLVYDFADSTTVAGVIRLVGEVPGMLAFENVFRATFLLKKTAGGFKILHEHVSGALVDPYGIGDWKKREE